MNRSSEASFVKLSSPTNSGARSRSHDVRLIASVARIGPADRTASPINVGARKRSAQRPSPPTGPPPRRTEPRPGAGRDAIAVTAPSASGSPHPARGRSLAGEDVVQGGDDGVQRLLGGLDRLVEDLRVELGLERGRE